MSLFEIMLAAVVVLGICALGCATPPITRRLPASIFAGVHLHARGDRARLEARPRAPVQDESAAYVERTLRARGLRFGTDGSSRALWGYMRTSQTVVDKGGARPGDVLFFDTRRRQDQERECADRAGVVRQVDGGGRITFIEAREGALREEYVHPGFPMVRRDPGGQILNSFLRPKRIEDPAGTRYFAGEMLCGIARPRAR